MPSIFPESPAAGGVVIRDADGVATNPANVERAYSPAPPFDSSCLITALPSDCTARLEPRQVNAIVSELVAFAECMDPNGSWDCNSLQNLCAAFTAWAAANANVLIADTPPASPVHTQMWWESDTGILFIYYDDGTSAQWVQITNGFGALIVVDGVSIIGAGTVADPHRVGALDCGVW